MENVSRLEFNTMEGTTSNMTINGVPVNNKVLITGTPLIVILEVVPSIVLNSNLDTFSIITYLR